MARGLDQTLLVSASSVVTLWRLGRPPNNPEPAQRSNQSQSPAGAVKAVERRHLVPDKTNPRTTSIRHNEVSMCFQNEGSPVVVNASSVLTL